MPLNALPKKFHSQKFQEQIKYIQGLKDEEIIIDEENPEITEEMVEKALEEGRIYRGQEGLKKIMESQPLTQSQSSTQANSNPNPTKNTLGRNTHKVILSIEVSEEFSKDKGKEDLERMGKELFRLLETGQIKLD